VAARQGMDDAAVHAGLEHAHQSCAPLCVRFVASTSHGSGGSDQRGSAGRVGCQLSVGRQHWGRAVRTDDPLVADNEQTAVGWFEADALPTPLMKSSHARIAHAMAYRSHPETVSGSPARSPVRTGTVRAGGRSAIPRLDAREGGCGPQTGHKTWPRRRRGALTTSTAANRGSSAEAAGPAATSRMRRSRRPSPLGDGATAPVC
jgi:hypothetical protein